MKAVQYFNGFAITHIELVEFKKGKRKFRGKQDNGHWDEDLDQEWIDFNFKDRFPTFYKDVMNKKNIGRSFSIPSGAIEVDDSESDINDDIPKEFRVVDSVKYKFENKASCAFGNMANALSFFGDDMASDFFYNHREKDLDEMKQKYTKTGTEGSINSFHLAREIVRQQFKYQMRFVKHYDLMHVVEKYKNDVLYVQLHPVSSTFTHVVCIVKKQIVDGKFSTTITCTEKSIEWLLKDEHYNFIAYRIEITSKVRRILKNPTA